MVTSGWPRPSAGRGLRTGSLRTPPAPPAVIPSRSRVLIRAPLSATVLLALLAGCDRFKAGPQTDFSGEGAMTYVRAQVSFGPRVPGSDGHRRAGDWIVAEMR